MNKRIASALLVVSPLSAFAAVPTDVTTALTGGLTDAVAVAGLALIIFVGVAVFKYMRKGI